VHPDERWLEAMWPFVRSRLPTTAGSVLEVGCGPLGGFVPRVRGEGHAAVGVDPVAPAERGFHQVEFELYEPPRQVDAVVASVSLHHVADVGQVLDGVATALTPGGVLIVLEWALERFDEPTARWCFDRLPSLDPDDDHGPGWLQRHHDDWRESGEAWDAYLQSWLRAERLHPSDAILRELDARFDRQTCHFGPYFFAGLGDTTMADEQAAIDAATIQATGIQYAAVGRGP